MKTRFLSTVLIALACGCAASAQVNLPTSGDHEFTLGGSGTSDKGFDDSSGGLEFSYGKYVSDRWLVALRQSINYVNPENAGVAWNGSTRLAADYHFGTTRWRPFLGANIGYVYGDNVNDTWAAGLEGGLKYYVADRTFVFGMLEYAWLFNDATDVDDTFDDGRYVWSLGVGFNF